MGAGMAMEPAEGKGTTGGVGGCVEEGILLIIVGMRGGVVMVVVGGTPVMEEGAYGVKIPNCATTVSKSTFLLLMDKVVSGGVAFQEVIGVVVVVDIVVVSWVFVSVGGGKNSDNSLISLMSKSVDEDELVEVVVIVGVATSGVLVNGISGVSENETVGSGVVWIGVLEDNKAANDELLSFGPAVVFKIGNCGCGWLESNGDCGKDGNSGNLGWGERDGEGGGAGFDANACNNNEGFSLAVAISGGHFWFSSLKSSGGGRTIMGWLFALMAETSSKSGGGGGKIESGIASSRRCTCGEESLCWVCSSTLLVNSWSNSSM